MKIIFHMGHPGHFHLFKYSIEELTKKKHEILIIAFKKDVLIQLLKNYGYQFTIIGEKKKGIIKKIFNSFRVYIKLIKLLSKFKPELTVSIGSPYLAPVAKLFGAKNIAFNDTEHAREQRMIYHPFSDIILTPSVYELNLGKKQIRYNGYHELAYLHPNWFEPDPSVLDKLGVKKDDKYVIIRFVSWAASHDIRQTGFTDKEKIKLIRKIEKFAIPIITSEGKLLKELQKFQIKIPPHLIHDATYFATMYIGDGATMASEAAVLGVPAIYLNPLRMGYTNEEHKYGLVFQYYKIDNNTKTIFEDIDSILQTKKSTWIKIKDNLLKNKIDVTAFMIWFIENYPKSVLIMKENLNFQNRFK